MSELAIAVVGGLGAMLGWGAADFFAKVAVGSISELSALVWGHLVGTILLGVGALADIGAPERGAALAVPWVWVGVVVAGGVQALIYYLLYRGFAVGQVSVLSPTFASFSGIVALVSIVFLGESAAPVEIVALGAVFVGVMLLSAAPGDGSAVHFLRAPGFAPVLLAAGLAAVWTLGWAHIVSGRAPLLLAFAMYAAMTVTLLVIAIAHHELTVPRGSLAVVLVMIGVGEAVAYASLSWAYSSSDRVGVIALISGAFSIPTALLARTFLNERVSRYGLAGIGAVVIGAGVLAVAG